MNPKPRANSCWLAAAALSLIVVLAALAAERGLPPLRVVENQRFLVTVNGKPFFWLGDTAWQLFHRNNGKFPSGFRDIVGIQFQPRFGFAYDLFGNGKTAIRAGFGVAKQMLETTGSYMYTMGLNPPNIYTPVRHYATLDTFRNSTGVLFAGGVDSFERDYDLGVVYNYSLGIQQDVGHGLSLDAT